MIRIAFPRDFTWGAAASAYQVEGSHLADGASPSIWHDFSHRPGRIVDGSTGDTACDHYRRWPEDTQQMRALGLGAYRFSVAWNRVVPECGRVNPAGLDFYRRLVDGLLAAGIEPWVTLFHWETPAWLERRGGWRVRESVDHFLVHAEAVLRALGDRVKHWITINEPLVYATLGYAIGEYAPGRRRDIRGTFRASHHLLLAHARAAAAARAYAPGSLVGIAHHLRWSSPRDPSRARDRQAARLMDGITNRFFLDASLRGTYPDETLHMASRHLPRGFARDLEEQRGTVDFVGVNYYTRDVYRWSWVQTYTRARPHVDPAARRSPMWEIWPAGIYRVLARLRDEYGNPPAVITENGIPVLERPGADPLEDPERIDYLRDHVALVGKAIGDGCDCRGYFHWSLMDNFEWAHGLTMRFGLLRCDFATQQRWWRHSAFWFRDLLRANAIEIERLPAVDGDPAGPGA